MAFDWVSLLVVLHATFAVLWVGGAVFQGAVVGPALKSLGPQATPFLQAVYRRGGFSRYFMGVATLAIVSGIILYGRLKVHTDPFVGRHLWLNVGALLGLLAYLHGLSSMMPKDRKLGALMTGLKGPPTPEQAAEMQALARKIGLGSMVSTVLILVALLAMLGARFA